MSTDEVMPGKKWEFDESVTSCFDDMLARSIPQYELMRSLTFSLGQRFVREATDVVDLGCSRGEALAPFVDRFGAHNRFHALDVSEPMLEASRRRFEGLINCGVVRVAPCDLREEYPAVKASLTLSILTLQFTPIEYRSRILEQVFRSTVEGGAVLLVEKLLQPWGGTDRLFTEEYLRFKAGNGYSQEQIERKRLSLEGVLVPITYDMNVALLREAGFRHVESFWRYLNFAGFLAVKG